MVGRRYCRGRAPLPVSLLPLQHLRRSLRSRLPSYWLRGAIRRAFRWHLMLLLHLWLLLLVEKLLWSLTWRQRLMGWFLGRCSIILVLPPSLATACTGTARCSCYRC